LGHPPKSSYSNRATQIELRLVSLSSGVIGDNYNGLWHLDIVSKNKNKKE